jgi:hypothetical protein
MHYASSQNPRHGHDFLVRAGCYDGLARRYLGTV